MGMAISERSKNILISCKVKKKKAHTTEVKKHKMANDQVPTAKKIQDIMSF